MAIGKIGGIAATGYARSIVRRLATDPVVGDVFVLRGVVRFVDESRRRFALAQEGHAYNVGWTAATEFIGTDVAALRGVEVCVKGHVRADDFQADSVVAVR